MAAPVVHSLADARAAARDLTAELRAHRLECVTCGGRGPGMCADGDELDQDLAELSAAIQDWHTPSDGQGVIF